MLLRDIALIFFLFIVISVFLSMGMALYLNGSKKKKWNLLSKFLLTAAILPGWLTMAALSKLFDNKQRNRRR